MYKVSDPMMSLLVEKAIDECQQIYPEILEEIKRIMEEAKTSVLIKASQGKITEIV